MKYSEKQDGFYIIIFVEKNAIVANAQSIICELVVLQLFHLDVFVPRIFFEFLDSLQYPKHVRSVDGVTIFLPAFSINNDEFIRHSFS